MLLLPYSSSVKVDKLRKECLIFAIAILVSEHLWFKSPLLGLRQFLATECPLKMMKNAFYFTLKAFFVPMKITYFCQSNFQYQCVSDGIKAKPH